MNTIFDYSGKTVLVVGATRGIGKALAEGFLKAGAIVYGTGRSEESAATLDGTGIQGRAADVSKPGAVAAVLKEMSDKLGRIDCLVNNAGISSNTPASAFKEDEMDNIINTNFKGVFRSCQAYYKLQRKSGGGNIINVASVLGMVGYPLASVYSGTKGAVIQLTRSLAIEWAGAPFRVNAICPGFIETDMTSGMQKRKSVLDHTVAAIPLKRLGKPEDIPGAALYLGCDASAYVTGQTLVVDGGLTC